MIVVNTYMTTTDNITIMTRITKTHIKTIMTHIIATVIMIVGATTTTRVTIRQRGEFLQSLPISLGKLAEDSPRNSIV